MLRYGLLRTKDGNYISPDGYFIVVRVQRKGRKSYAYEVRVWDSSELAFRSVPHATFHTLGNAAQFVNARLVRYL